MTPHPAPALSVHHLTVNYGTTCVLWDVNVEVASGHCIGILGPNGAGKSTFIRAAMGLIPRTSGSILFWGESLEKNRSRIAYVPQRGSVDWDFPITVEQLVLMGRYGKLGLFQKVRSSDLLAMKQILEKVGLAPLAKRQIGQLSGGQQQRAFLARALLQDADLYFLDEPFTGVDQTTESVILNILHELRAQGKTIFVVHHDLSTVSRYFDWLILLNLRLVGEGPTRLLFREEMLEMTYGKSPTILTEAATLQARQIEGVEF